MLCHVDFFVRREISGPGRPTALLQPAEVTFAAAGPSGRPARPKARLCPPQGVVVYAASLVLRLQP